MGAMLHFDMGSIMSRKGIFRTSDKKILDTVPILTANKAWEGSIKNAAYWNRDI